MKKTVIVFDLDGTLVDSAQIIAQVVNESFERYGIAGLFEARHVGPPLEQMIGAAADLSPEQLALCVERFRERYEGEAKRTPLYRGALEAARALSKGSELWLATYKRRSPTEIILDSTGLGLFFEGRVLCADDRGGLSKSEMLAIAKEDNPGAWMAMVGDTQSDHDAAISAGYDAFAWARWGAALPILQSEELSLIHSDSFESFERAAAGAVDRARAGRME